MTEDEFLKAVGRKSDSKEDSEIGRFVLSLARLFVSLPIDPKEEGYAQQQGIIKELQRCEQQFGTDIGAYPTDMKLTLMMILRSVNQINDDATRYIIASIIFQKGSDK